MKYSHLFSLGAVYTLSTTPLFAEAAENAAPPDQGFTQTLVMIGFALIFFYFILWRPEQKRRKAMETQRDSIKKGDKVVAMGMVGTVIKINDQTVILRLYEGAKVEVLKAAISDVTPATDEEAKKAEASENA